MTAHRTPETIIRENMLPEGVTPSKVYSVLVGVQFHGRPDLSDRDARTTAAALLFREGAIPKELRTSVRLVPTPGFEVVRSD